MALRHVSSGGGRLHMRAMHPAGAPVAQPEFRQVNTVPSNLKVAITDTPTHDAEEAFFQYQDIPRKSLGMDIA